MQIGEIERKKQRERGGGGRERQREIKRQREKQRKKRERSRGKVTVRVEKVGNIVRENAFILKALSLSILSSLVNNGLY